MTDRLPDPWLVQLVTELHCRIRAAVRDDLASRSHAVLSAFAREGAGDISFQVDVRPEEITEQVLGNPPQPLIVVCEGLGRRVFPDGASESQARWCVIVDPLDGSREISYGKRSAWVLSGIAPAHPAPTLADIVWAVQTEVPPAERTSGVVMTAALGHGAHREVWDLATDSLLTGQFDLAPSVAATIAGGFAVFADYFSGSHALVGQIADQVFDRVLGPAGNGAASVFNDQYLSSGGCMYLLASGAYRFFADLRPTVGRLLDRAGRQVGLCAHPYDLCTHLIASEAGVIITGADGGALSYPLSTDADCEWAGYANDRIRQEVWPALASVLDNLR